MLNNKTVAVVVPAYNEETQIAMVIETMPEFVDRIVIVNDCSTDQTEKIVKQFIDSSRKIPLKNNKKINLSKSEKKYNHAKLVMQKKNEDEINFFLPSKVVNLSSKDDQIVLINQLKNGGVGASIARGYKWCKDNKIDCTAVMAGDGQMDPNELESICLPVIDENIDYVKGNRLIHRSAWFVIPKVRYFGNSILSILTKIASGYWHVSDTQTGFTAISLKALNAIPLYKIYKSYGMPNDLLVKLNIAFCTIKEVEIKPVYNIGEDSKMKISKVIPKIAWLLFKSFFKRLWIKYLFKDFHPLFLLYHAALFLGIIWLPYLYKILNGVYFQQSFSFEPLLAFTFLGLSSFQFFMFAMWMDIQDNERLYK